MAFQLNAYQNPQNAVADLKRKEELKRIEGYQKERDDLSSLLSQQPEFMSATGSDQFKTLNDFAYGTADSPYAKLQKERAASATAEGLDQVGADAAGGLSNVYNSLAMGGGLQGGSRERLAADSSRNSIMERQKTRRAGADSLLDIDAAQADQRIQAQDKALNMVTADKSNLNAYTQDKFNQKLAADTAQRKSEAEREIAAKNSCFAEGTYIKTDKGQIKVEDVQVGMRLPGGTVYTIQKSLAPHRIHHYRGTYITGGHAVLEDGVWKRIKDSVHGVEVQTPVSVHFIYNFGVTNHWIETSQGVVMSDLHESDDYETKSDVECLEELNKKWAEPKRA